MQIDTQENLTKYYISFTICVKVQTWYTLKNQYPEHRDKCKAAYCIYRSPLQYTDHNSPYDMLEQGTLFVIMLQQSWKWNQFLRIQYAQLFISEWKVFSFICCITCLHNECFLLLLGLRARKQSNRIFDNIDNMWEEIQLDEISTQ